MAEEARYAALADWFAQHPHQRPPASGATASLRAFLADLEVQYRKGALSPPQQAAIAHWRIPLGKGHLLPVGEEWVLLRRISNVKALAAQHGPLRGVQDHRLPADLGDWIRALRRLRQANPRDLSVQLVQRLDPHFPWRDALGSGLWYWLQKGVYLLRRLARGPGASPLLPGGRQAIIEYRL